MRMHARSIGRTEILQACNAVEIIEEYEAEQRLPSCLCLGRDAKGRFFHCVIALDHDGDEIHVVTAYYPDSTKWEPGFRKRKRS